MIDERVERIVDWACERAPAFFRPRIMRLSAWAFGWRVNLYAGTACRSIAALVRQASTENGVERFLQQQMGRKMELPYVIRRAEMALERAGARFLAVCRDGRFAAALYLTMLAALGVCVAGGAHMAACAASLCLLWLAVAMEEEYPPVSSGVRQVYLASALLRGASMLPLLLSFFLQYARLGVRSNIVLQSAMVVTLCMHLAFHVPLVLLNRRQPMLLRAMATVLGAVPALTAAASIAAAFAASSGTNAQVAAAALGALGACLAFVGEQLASAIALGGIRLRHQDVYLFLLTTVGFALMIGGAWLFH